MPHRVYVEVPVTDGTDVDYFLSQVPGEVRKVVLLVWFDAENQPTPRELDKLGADFWDAH